MLLFVSTNVEPTINTLRVSVQQLSILVVMRRLRLLSAHSITFHELSLSQLFSTEGVLEVDSLNNMHRYATFRRRLCAIAATETVN